MKVKVKVKVKVRVVILLLAIVILASLTLACNDWDGMDRTNSEYNGVLTRQVESREVPNGTLEVGQ